MNSLLGVPSRTPLQCCYRSAMRLLGSSTNGSEFDANRVLAPPTLLAIPFGILAAASIQIEWQWVWQRFIGSILLLSIAIACAFGAMRRRQPRLRIESLAHAQSSADDDFYLELCRCDPAEPIANRFPYATLLVDKSGTRRAFLQSPLAEQLNTLRRIQKLWNVNVRAGVLLPDIFHKVLNEETDLRITRKTNAVLKSPVRDRQLATAGIIFAISLFALTVVFFLVTGQLDMGGPVTTLGLLLGALLVSAPLVIAVHLALGHVRVRIDNDWLHLERRRGVLGTKVSEIPLTEINGIWLIRTEQSGIYELLMLTKGSFLSLPVAQSAWPNWQAVFCRSDSFEC